jgi:LysM repeat protein
LQSIADRYDLNVAQLKQINRIHGNQIKAGQVIRVSMGNNSEESVSHNGNSNLSKIQDKTINKHGHTTHTSYKSNRTKFNKVSTRSRYHKHK